LATSAVSDIILATSMISHDHSVYSRYEILLIAKFSTSLLSIYVSLVNITLDSDEFDSINDRIESILSEVSESMKIKLV
jgi:hypothetical protein